MVIEPALYLTEAVLTYLLLETFVDQCMDPRDSSEIAGRLELEIWR
jgi:hypothetical protein